ncbi:uroporphyrinogen decarboxylase [Actinoplanes sp. NPDC051411]|uniref:uroporphyrinogen decarboxylase n=1 Tax=Actinoplanes sp. NPDC051411 TaxID=3155522 RepID=UPI0034167D83
MSAFIDAARGQDAARAPIWIMRQAGRYLPEYREIKERYGFWEMCRTPDLITEITLQPIRRFGMDAAILFSDIMTPLAECGVRIDFAPGPVIAEPVRTREQIARLRTPGSDEIAPYVVKGVRAVREQTEVPLIGFAGAPLTLATYLVEGQGSKDYSLFRNWLYEQPGAAHELLGKLTEVTIAYLRAQIGAGVQAVQLFDSWAGLHDAASYETFGRPYADRVLRALGPGDVPRIYLAIGAHHLYPQIGTLAAEAISVDWRTPLSHARRMLPGKALQGNLDPSALCAPPEVLLERAGEVLRQGLGGPHIFNLGHGIGPSAPVGNVQRLVEFVQGFDRTAAFDLTAEGATR